MPLVTGVKSCIYIYYRREEITPLVTGVVLQIIHYRLEEIKPLLTKSIQSTKFVR